MVRLFVPAERIEGGKAAVTPDDWAYLTQVLRLGSGDALEIFDGAGSRIEARLTATAGMLELVGPARQDAPAAGPRLSLWQGLPKGEKLELVIQKAAELGASEIVPLFCRRSVARLPAGRAAAKLARWRKVAAEAARQCGRADVPLVAPPAGVDALCALARGGTKVLILDPAGAEGLAGALAALGEERRVAVAVGPEGGFEPAELEAVVAAGGHAVRLGARVLRTETAGLVACALWALSVGELG